MSDIRGSERVLVDVWDAPTRALHWINAGLVITLILLIIGKEGMEALNVDEDTLDAVAVLHAAVGHVFILTFFLRIVWGFLGNRYARWLDIIPYNGERWRDIATGVKWYMSFFKRRPAVVRGHDPLASLFYIALFLVLISQIVTGVLLSGTEFNFPLGSLFVSSMSDTAKDALADALGGVHEAGAWFVMFFIAAHLFGMVVHEIKERTGLFSSMIHGKKYMSKDDM